MCIHNGRIQLGRHLLVFYTSAHHSLVELLNSLCYHFYDNFIQIITDHLDHTACSNLNTGRNPIMFLCHLTIGHQYIEYSDLECLIRFFLAIINCVEQRNRL